MQAILASTMRSQGLRTAQVSEVPLGLPEFEVASIKPTDRSPKESSISFLAGTGL